MYGRLRWKFIDSDVPYALLTIGFELLYLLNGFNLVNTERQDLNG